MARLGPASALKTGDSPLLGTRSLVVFGLPLVLGVVVVVAFLLAHRPRAKPVG